ncbi:Fructokinase-2 [Thalictrum thalictroides]|uniref:Fructokinase-2 n=1 Tax=Thalictrum thalictroides TaxID=46969 RepID=A0A7J6V1G1_THATH|nr:Fructokinase-2 [Thalictrum thalictroides]
MDSWTKLVVMRINVINGVNYMQIYPISPWKDGEILLRIDSRKFVSYNFESGSYTLFQIDGLPENYNLINDVRVQYHHYDNLGIGSLQFRKDHRFSKPRVGWGAMKAAKEAGDADDENNVLSFWFDDGLKLLVVTDDGEKGCRYFTKNFKGKLSGFAVDIVDTTGAGDSFVGAFLYSVAKDNSIFETFANACGALATIHKGAIPALPTTAAALDLISKSKST